MVDSAKITEQLKAPILLASFEIDSALESSIAVFRTKDELPDCQCLTADLILASTRIDSTSKQSLQDKVHTKPAEHSQNNHSKNGHRSNRITAGNTTKKDCVCEFCGNSGT